MSVIITTLYRKVESLKKDISIAKQNNNKSLIPILTKNLREAENFLNGLTDAVDNPHSDSNVLIIKKHK